MAVILGSNDPLFADETIRVGTETERIVCL